VCAQDRLALKGLTMNSPAGRGILTHGKGGQHPRIWTLTGSTNGASSLVASGSFSIIGWPRLHGLKPVEEGRHRDLPLHEVSPFGALVLGRHPAFCAGPLLANFSRFPRLPARRYGTYSGQEPGNEKE
jgi:hypothetical protein